MLINHKLYTLNYTFPVSLVLLTPLFPKILAVLPFESDFQEQNCHKWQGSAV